MRGLEVAEGQTEFVFVCVLWMLLCCCCYCFVVGGGGGGGGLFVYVCIQFVVS